jgi:TonB family protein
MKALLPRLIIVLAIGLLFGSGLLHSTFSQNPTKPAKVSKEDESCPEPVYAKKDLTKSATLKSKFEMPDFTEEAKRKGVKGCVYLKVVLCKSGKVTDIRVISGLPYGLTERMIKAARKLQFRPAEKEGELVSQWLQVEGCFNVQ